MEKDSFQDELVCPWWLGPGLNNALRRWVQKPEQVLAGLVGEGQIAMDIGCGPGYFTIPMARIVGPQGLVIAVDLQEKMLSQVRRHAERAGLLAQIRLHQCQSTQVGLMEKADFALAFWMVHEVSDQAAFLGQVRELLKPGALFLLAEPLVHVSGPAFKRTIERAQSAGLRSVSGRSVPLSRAMIFERV